MPFEMQSKWRRKQPKLQKCVRCGLNFPKTDLNCEHCNHLNESGLKKLKDRLEIDNKRNASIALYFICFSAIIGTILFVSFV